VPLAHFNPQHWPYPLQPAALVFVSYGFIFFEFESQRFELKEYVAPKSCAAAGPGCPPSSPLELVLRREEF
jgi:hypothetical protein